MHLLAASGEARAAHGLARLFLRRELTGPVTVAEPRDLEVAYPLAFRELVLTHAKDADGLHPDLLQALDARGERLGPGCAVLGGKPRALSAHARDRGGGRRQAAAEAAHHDRGAARAVAEHSPGITLICRTSSSCAKGVKQYALGAYNAGEGSVGRWRRAAPDVPLDVWVETICSKETRGYVKRVLRSYNTYKLLYAPNEVPRTVAPATRATAKPGAWLSPGSHPKT